MLTANESEKVHSVPYLAGDVTNIPDISGENARAQAYEFLASIFLKEPSREIFLELQSWAECNQEPEAIGLFKRIAQDDPDLTGLRQEYYDLFFVPVSECFIPPFESAIRDAGHEAGKKTRFGSYLGKATMEVAALYEQTEFQPERLAIFEPLRQSNLPDHIGFELSFMTYLCHLEEEEQKSGLTANQVRRLEQEFLQKHLNHWLPLLVQELSLVDQSGYYLYFVKLARDFCLEEKTELISHLMSETGGVI